MSNHLSEDQFAKCVVGGSTGAERQHLNECAVCSAELDRFSRTLSLFRSNVRERIDAHVVSHPADRFSQFSVRPDSTGMPMWRWALLAAAALFAVIVPFLTRDREPREVVESKPPQVNADALMNAVNRHLSRTVPAPMEPMMVLISDQESIDKSGGVQ